MSDLRRERSLRTFLDTSVLSEESLDEVSSDLAEHVLSGDKFLVSVLTHFQILWGYRKAGFASTRYESFLTKLGVDVAPLVEEDAGLAARKKPSRGNLVDALIAATASRYEAVVWTKDKDFLRFLPKEKVTFV